MKKLSLKTFLKILIIISPVVLFVLAYFGAKFFDAHDSHSTCITLTLFGFYCPACGMTRSVIALMNGDILLSIRQNAMVLVFALLYAVFYIWYILRFFNVKFYLFLQNEWFWYILIIVWFIYGISRNFIPPIAPI
ncbi:MAG: DUF2752 domain-containing protein [Oscillospiraceae bacterium]|nr:DUF2752 domain-containing protein [Candidatus Ruminococcus equi]